MYWLKEQNYHSRTFMCQFIWIIQVDFLVWWIQNLLVTSTVFLFLAEISVCLFYVVVYTVHFVLLANYTVK